MAFPAEIKKKIVHSVEDAVGDDILTDIRQNNLFTNNNVPSRIWDLINTNLANSLASAGCTVLQTHSGPWKLVVVYEEKSQFILTFMREKRFEELQRLRHRRSHMHYLDMLSKVFNEKLEPDPQFKLFDHHFSDENNISARTQTFLRGFQEESTTIRHHMLILFETTGFQLSHIRAVMITPNFDIAQNCNDDWSEYISANESIVVEKVSEPIAPVNQPNRGLMLTNKALARKKNKPQRKANLLERES